MSQYVPGHLTSYGVLTSVNNRPVSQYQLLEDATLDCHVRNMRAESMGLQIRYKLGVAPAVCAPGDWCSSAERVFTEISLPCTQFEAALIQTSSQLAWSLERDRQF